MSIATETDECTCEWDVNDELMTLDMHCPDHGYLWDGDGADLTQEQTTIGALHNAEIDLKRSNP